MRKWVSKICILTMMTVFIMMHVSGQAYASPEYTGTKGWLRYSGLYMKKINGE